MLRGLYRTAQTASSFSSLVRSSSSLSSEISSFIPPFYVDDRVHLSLSRDRVYDVNQKQGFIFPPYSLVFELHPIVPIFNGKTHGFDRPWEYSMYGITMNIYKMQLHFSDSYGSRVLFPTFTVQYDLDKLLCAVTNKVKRADLMALTLLNVDEKLQDALSRTISERSNQLLEPTYRLIDLSGNYEIGKAIISKRLPLYGPAPVRDGRMLMSSVLHAFNKSMPSTLMTDTSFMSLSPAALTLIIIEELYGNEYAAKIAKEFGNSKQFVESLTNSPYQAFAAAHMKTLEESAKRSSSSPS